MCPSCRSILTTAFRSAKVASWGRSRRGPAPERIEVGVPVLGRVFHRSFGYNPCMRKACVLAMMAMAGTFGIAQEPEKFYSAIRDNNLAQLKTLLEPKATASMEPKATASMEPKAAANIADDRGITPLMVAAEVGSLEAMRLLIDRG